MSPSRKPPTQPALFAEALREWMHRLGLKQRDLAAEAHIAESTLSHWLRGDRPSVDMESLVWLLVTLYCRFREAGLDWTVADALDTIAPIGRTWEDVRQTLGNLHGPNIRTFREWWEKGKPQPLSPPPAAALHLYVERKELAHLRQRITAWDGFRQPRWRAVVIHGVAGAGKTTLVEALARDETVRRAFRDGVLLLKDWAPEGLLAHACWQASLDPPPGREAAAWARWAALPTRRLLIIVDDITPGATARGKEHLEALRELLLPLGPQVVVVVTTQFGTDVQREMAGRFGPERVAEIPLRGLAEDETVRLVERVLERPLTPPERERMTRTAEALGWHPEGLRLAAFIARDAGWDAADQSLEPERMADNWKQLRRLVNRQWWRMGDNRRKQMGRLIWRTARGGPFGPALAAAVWKTDPATTADSLQDLERMGMVERVTVYPTEWWREGETELWRVAPVVWRVIRGKADRLERTYRRWERTGWRIGVLARSLAANPPEWSPAPPAPASLALVSTALTLLLIVPKYLVLVLLALAERMVGRRGWARRWELWTVTGTWLTVLRAVRERRRVFPSEEMELLEVQARWQVNSLLALEYLIGAGTIVADAVLRLRSLPQQADAVWWWGFLAAMGLLVLAMVTGVSRLYWMDVLYGVRTWDLALMVRLALALSRPLAGLGPVRRERERLREAWERGGRNP